MKRLIVALLLLLSLAAFAQQYTPLTLDEAQAYIKTMAPDALAQQIIKLDYIEHAKPDLFIPGVVYGLAGRDLLIAYPGEAPKIELIVKPYLAYSIPLKPERIKNFVPTTSAWRIIGTILITGATSSAFFAFSSPSVIGTNNTLPPVARWGAATSIGSLVGGFFYLVTWPK
jgi:hypothetical protein